MTSGSLAPSGCPSTTRYRLAWPRPRPRSTPSSSASISLARAVWVARVPTLAMLAIRSRPGQQYPSGSAWWASASSTTRSVPTDSDRFQTALVGSRSVKRLHRLTGVVWSAEGLEVFERGRSTQALRVDVVNGQVEVCPAFPASVGIALEHCPPQLCGDLLLALGDTNRRRFRCRPKIHPRALQPHQLALKSDAGGALAGGSAASTDVLASSAAQEEHIIASSEYPPPMLQRCERLFDVVCGAVEVLGKSLVRGVDVQISEPPQRRIGHLGPVTKVAE